MLEISSISDTHLKTFAKNCSLFIISFFYMLKNDVDFSQKEMC